MRLSLGSMLTLVWVLSISCSQVIQIEPSAPAEQTSFSYLALGDSYTIGESVAGDLSFPAQLKRFLEEKNDRLLVDLQIVATTGWTTSDLLEALSNKKISEDQDLITLLIGVNNQYQDQPFALYEKEFVILLNKAIQWAGGHKDRVIVVSIPDYAFTPFGQTRPSPETISKEIDAYNEFARLQCELRQVKYVNITDITRQGLVDAQLVATDRLHPSGAAYSLFVRRIGPLVLP